MHLGLPANPPASNPLPPPPARGGDKPEVALIRDIERYAQAQQELLKVKLETALSEFAKARNIGGKQEVENFLSFVRQIAHKPDGPLRPAFKAAAIPGSAEEVGADLLAAFGLPPDLPLANFRDNRWRQQLINSVPPEKAHSVHLVYRLMEDAELVEVILARLKARAEAAAGQLAPEPAPAMVSQPAPAPVPSPVVPPRSPPRSSPRPSARAPPRPSARSRGSPEMPPVGELCALLDLPEHVRVEAMHIPAALAEKSRDGWSSREVAAASILRACQQAGIPLTFEKIRQTCNVDLKDKSAFILRAVLGRKGFPAPKEVPPPALELPPVPRSPRGNPPPVASQPASLRGKPNISGIRRVDASGRIYFDSKRLYVDRSYAGFSLTLAKGADGTVRASGPAGNAVPVFARPPKRNATLEPERREVKKDGHVNFDGNRFYVDRSYAGTSLTLAKGADGTVRATGPAGNAVPVFDRQSKRNATLEPERRVVRNGGCVYLAGKCFYVAPSLAGTSLLLLKDADGTIRATGPAGNAVPVFDRQLREACPRCGRVFAGAGLQGHGPRCVANVIDAFAQQLGVSTGVHDSALELLRLPGDPAKFRLQGKYLAAALIFVAANQHGAPITIAQMSACGVQLPGRALYQVQEVVAGRPSIDSRQSGLTSLVFRLSQQLRLPANVERRAQEIAARAWSQRGEGNPTVISATCVYLACRELGAHVPQTIIARQAKVSGGALRRMIGHIEPLLAKPGEKSPSRDAVTRTYNVDNRGRFLFAGDEYVLPQLANSVLRIEARGDALQVLALDGTALGSIDLASKTVALAPLPQPSGNMARDQKHEILEDLIRQADSLAGQPGAATNALLGNLAQDKNITPGSPAVREVLLQNPSRRKIFELITSTPGINFFSIKKALKLGSNAAVWHLDVLVKLGCVQLVRHKGAVLYAPPEDAPEEVIRRHIIRGEVAQAILAQLSTGPKTVDEMARQSGLDRRNFYYTAKKLVAARLVDRVSSKSGEVIFSLHSQGPSEPAPPSVPPTGAGAASPVRPPANRRVDAWGRIRFDGKRLFVGPSLAGTKLLLLKDADGTIRATDPAGNVIPVFAHPPKREAALEPGQREVKPGGHVNFAGRRFYVGPSLAGTSLLLLKDADGTIHATDLAGNVIPVFARPPPAPNGAGAASPVRPLANRQVNARGRISFDGKRLFVAASLAGTSLLLLKDADGTIHATGPAGNEVPVFARPPPALTSAGAASPVRPPANRRVDAAGRIYFDGKRLHVAPALAGQVLIVREEQGHPVVEDAAGKTVPVIAIKN